MRIFALTVGRNEEFRYLEPMLTHTSQFVDGHFFFDDRSDDETAKVAFAAGCHVVRRAPSAPSFVQNEGAFRGQAWNAFEYKMSPTVNDWVLVIDCDEALVSPNIPERYALEAASAQGFNAVTLSIPEVFGFDTDGCPLIRVDGMWPTIHAPRFFRYQSGGGYAHGEFGVPAVPSYVMGLSRGGTDLALMHYGYADKHDQVVKFGRYAGHFGHSSAHVNSILSVDQELVRWGGPYVKEMRRGDS